MRHARRLLLHPDRRNVLRLIHTGSIAADRVPVGGSTGHNWRLSKADVLRVANDMRAERR